MCCQLNLQNDDWFMQPIAQATDTTPQTLHNNYGNSFHAGCYLILRSMIDGKRESKNFSGLEHEKFRRMSRCCQMTNEANFLGKSFFILSQECFISGISLHENASLKRELLLWHPKCRHTLYSNNCVSDNLL